MGVTIGHARGGDPTYTPGDQGGGEVRTQAWYDGKWDFVARFRNRDMAARAARICRMVCENQEIGYSQARRNDLRAAAMKCNWDISAIRRPADCDCSSLMSFCAEAAGVKNLERPGGNAPCTGNMRQLLGKTGAFEILTDAKYRSSDKYLMVGDVLVNEKQHTAMALMDGELATTLQTRNSYPVGDAHTREENAAEVRENGKMMYTVIPGDTLWGIAVAHHTTVLAICDANGLDSAAFIYPGQRLEIPS